MRRASAVFGGKVRLAGEPADEARRGERERLPAARVGDQLPRNRRAVDLVPNLDAQVRARVPDLLGQLGAVAVKERRVECRTDIALRVLDPLDYGIRGDTPILAVVLVVPADVLQIEPVAFWSERQRGPELLVTAPGQIRQSLAAGFVMTDAENRHLSPRLQPLA